MFYDIGTYVDVKRKKNINLQVAWCGAVRQGGQPPPATLGQDLPRSGWASAPLPSSTLTTFAFTPRCLHFVDHLNS